MKVKIGDLTRIKTGKLDANASSEDGEYPFFTCSREPLKISDYSYDCECVLVAGNGDLNVKYYNGKFDAYQRTYIIEDDSNGCLFMPYLYYFMEGYVDELRKQAIGGVIKYIKLGNLTDVMIELPPFIEQKNIVAILKKVRQCLNFRKKQINLLNGLITARFVELLGDPVHNTSKWPTKPFSTLGSLDRGRSKHRPRNAPELLNGPYPLIQTGDIANSGLYITEYHNTYTELGLKQSKLWKAGTLCITIAANIAQTAILTFDACFPDSVVGFVPNTEVNVIYMHYWFSFFQKILEEQAPQVGQKNINLKILSALQVMVPTCEHQKEFAAFVIQTEKSKIAIQKSIDEIQILFNSLMQGYFG